MPKFIPADEEATFTVKLKGIKDDATEAKFEIIKSNESSELLDTVTGEIQGSKAVCTWKAKGPEPDADYPVRLVGHYSYDAAWRGRGTVTFERPDATAAPYSSHVLAVLAELPVLGYEPATMVRGSMKLPRTGVRRLS